MESTVSVLNLTARRIAKEDERDLEQARIGIDAVRAWLDLLPEEAAGQIRNALSELQMLYAQAVEGKPLGGPAEGEEAPGPSAARRPRRHQPRGRLSRSQGAKGRRRASGRPAAATRPRPRLLTRLPPS